MPTLTSNMPHVLQQKELEFSNKVLLVDEDIYRLKLYTLMFNQLNLNLYTTTSAEKALNLPASFDYSLAFIDLNLSNMNSYRLASDLFRSRNATQPLFILWEDDQSTSVHHSIRKRQGNFIETSTPNCVAGLKRLILDCLDSN